MPTGTNTYAPSATWAAVAKDALTAGNPPTLAPLEQGLPPLHHLESQGTT